ncbi:MAG TPA: helix-turn-helix domain-containing protein [Solirubrobacterales bacterium]|nr:helix-turn-helix domain-containing protein [Solirubrobacterales bacterium]
MLRPSTSEVRLPKTAPLVTDASERARIVAALIEVGAEHGYLDTTIEMIVERAGVEREAFHRHFTSKYDCFLSTWHDINDQCVARIMNVYESHKEWADRLRAVANDIARSLELAPERALFGIEVLASGRAARARRDMTLRVITSLIDAGRNEMEDPDAVPHSTAEALAGAAYCQMFAKVADGAHEELSALVPQLMSAAVMPYLGVEAAIAELTIHSEQPA